MFVAAVSARAQTQLNVTETVLDHVKDPSGAAIPGAKARLHNEQAGMDSALTIGAARDDLFIYRIPDIYDVNDREVGVPDGQDHRADTAVGPDVVTGFHAPGWVDDAISDRSYH